MPGLPWFTTLFLFLSVASLGTTCSDVCTFLYNDSNWENVADVKDAQFTINLNSGTTSGIITAEFRTVYYLPENFLKLTCPSLNRVTFLTELESNLNVSLAFWFYPSKTVNVMGFISGNKKISEVFRFPEQTGDYFQISDRSPYYYTIAMGNTNSRSMVSKDCNYRSNKTWEDFQNGKVRLSDTVTITSEGKCVVFKYISVCPDPTPRLCEDSFSVVEAQLGETYTLTCSASGAPFLYASWIHDGKHRTNSHETYVVDEPTHRITSQIEINSFTTNDVGNWTCTIFNKNFGSQVTKTIEYLYSRTIAVTHSPSYEFYTPRNGSGTLFEWVVEGWPLDQVSLGCDGINATKITKNSSGYLNENPPLVKFALMLHSEKQVLCTLYDGDRILNTKNITKEGFGCMAGEKGKGKSCEECPTGETSHSESLECFSVKTKCEEGTYGMGDDCKICPRGTTSLKYAVKVQECFVIRSSCDEGTYGTDVCKNCPKGEISMAGSVKVQECFQVTSSCNKGEFGYNNNCTKCPIGTISENYSVKVQECMFVSSTCEKGEYGTDSEMCHSCPHGSDSIQYTVKIQDCEFKESFCSEGYYGVRDNCSPCPSGESSYQNALKAKDCFPIRANNLPLIFGLGVGAAVLVIGAMIILAVALIRHWAKLPHQADLPLTTNAAENNERSKVRMQEDNLTHAATINPLYGIHDLTGKDSTSQVETSALPAPTDVSDKADLEQIDLYETFEEVTVDVSRTTEGPLESPYEILDRSAIQRHSRNHVEISETDKVLDETEDDDSSKYTTLGEVPDCKADNALPSPLGESLPLEHRTSSTMGKRKNKLGHSFSSKGKNSMQNESSYATLKKEFADSSNRRRTVENAKVGVDRSKSMAAKHGVIINLQFDYGIRNSNVEGQVDIKGFDQRIIDNNKNGQDDDDDDYETFENFESLKTETVVQSAHKPAGITSPVESKTSPIYSQVNRRYQFFILSTV